jgi:hypothetical protein
LSVLRNRIKILRREFCEDADLFEIIILFCRTARFRVSGDDLLILNGGLLILLFNINISENAFIETFNSLIILIKILKIAARK